MREYVWEKQLTIVSYYIYIYIGKYVDNECLDVSADEIK